MISQDETVEKTEDFVCAEDYAIKLQKEVKQQFFDSIKLSKEMLDKKIEELD